MIPASIIEDMQPTSVENYPVSDPLVTARSLPLLSGHGQNNTVLSGQPRPALALVGAVGAASAFIGAASPSSRFCRGCMDIVNSSQE